MDGRKGAVEVVYLEERLPEGEGPFLAEERSLLNGVAEGLKVYLDRKWLESEILEISDREQRRIGQDLHDGLSQHLRGIAYLSHVLQKDLAQESLPGAKDPFQHRAIFHWSEPPERLVEGEAFEITVEGEMGGSNPGRHMCWETFRVEGATHECVGDFTVEGVPASSGKGLWMSVAVGQYMPEINATGTKVPPPGG